MDTDIECCCFLICQSLCAIANPVFFADVLRDSNVMLQVGKKTARDIVLCDSYCIYICIYIYTYAPLT